MTKAMVINDMSFKVGQTLTLVGEVKPDAATFSINIGHRDQHIALHINPRFNLHGDKNTVVCNSNHGGDWGEEHRERDFPFHQGKEFKIITMFTSAGFVMVLSNGCIIRFPNRLGAQKYSFFSFMGDARIKSIEVK
ncbi:beta-galactoside-binding lectin-like [Odontesthes bonariensis]|uniref:beta-galactoside-binding lectin-like n=1 Tax=Odontesthes bonariensis TaxID=219752 RepID=UPI003F58F84E